jgi:cation-transporting ATPase 13A3/4/5
MLFPKPFGFVHFAAFSTNKAASLTLTIPLRRFAFYRDSFRFIGVLGMVAVLGFMASSVNFVKLGVSRSLLYARILRDF